MKQLFAFDLDGTLYKGNKAVQGTPELVTYLQHKGHTVVYHTNNSTKSIKQLQDKLNKLGFPSDGINIYSSGSLTARYCKENNIDHGYILGSVELVEMIWTESIGFHYSIEEPNLIVGLDDKFDYRTIAFCLSILERNGKFIVCNMDANYPISGNVLAPGCGALVSALKTASGRDPDIIVGKPNRYLLDCICKDYAITAMKDITIIGDSYESDNELARYNNTNFIYIKNQNQYWYRGQNDSCPCFQIKGDWKEYIYENY